MERLHWLPQMQKCSNPLDSVQACHFGHQIPVDGLGSLKELTLAWAGYEWLDREPHRGIWGEYTIQAWAQLTSLTRLTLCRRIEEDEESLLPEDLNILGRFGLPLEVLEVLTSQVVL